MHSHHTGSCQTQHRCIILSITNLPDSLAFVSNFLRKLNLQVLPPRNPIVCACSCKEQKLLLTFHIHLRKTWPRSLLDSSQCNKTGISLGHLVFSYRNGPTDRIWGRIDPYLQLCIYGTVESSESTRHSFSQSASLATS